jgi:hypothetical protein
MAGDPLTYSVPRYLTSYNTNGVWNSSSTLTTSNVIYNPSTFEATYQDPVTYKAVRITDLLTQDVVEAGPKRETDMAWLKRRVSETCWRPA